MKPVFISFDKLDKWDKRFLDLASHVSQWSKDPSTKVGSVIANGKFVNSLGYNGFPPMVDDKDAWLKDKATKYSLTIHAEMNAIFNSPGSVKGMDLYVSPLFPCPSCAKHIAASGIERVIALVDTNSTSPFLQTLEETTLIFNLNGVETLWVIRK